MRGDSKKIAEAIDRLTVAVRELTAATATNGGPPQGADGRLQAIRDLAGRASS